MSFAGKVAVITGGTRGLGRAIATGMVTQGAKAVLSYGSDSKSAEETIALLGADNVVVVQADAGSIEGVEKLVKTAVDKFGKIDILVPNAGFLAMETVGSASEATFDKAFSVNVKGPYFLVQKAVPHMAPGSTVVFMSTTQNHASTVTGIYTLYCATKGAIEQMVRTMAKDLGAKGITVNACAPGPTATDGFYQGKTEEMVQTVAGFSPLKRLGKPEDIANAVMFLSSPAAAWVNGQILRTNGGMA